MDDYLSLGLSPSIVLLRNLSESALIELAIRQDPENKLSSEGALVIRTGQFTGRATEDKYVVEDSFSLRVIDWKSSLKKMGQDTFQSIKEEMLQNFNVLQTPVFITTKSVSADPNFAMKVTLVTNSAAHALFCHNIFRDQVDEYPLGNFTIFHSPNYKVDKLKHKTHSSTVIAINFSSSEIIIAGTGYCGEIKKSIFSVLNTLLPEHGVLPMHTGSNLDKKGKSSLFFGLSGTGKTTLSTDIDVEIIGDDEHGLSEQGIFNFEGGCYAKTDGLKLETEPDIFKAANHFKTLLENVVLDPDSRAPLYNDKSLTENGRATYSLNTLGHVVKNSRGPIPSNIFFLSADALGVLPPVSRLNIEQAMYFFLSGYTAKLAGTELGLKGVKTTFSHCFGAPFMMRRPHDYGQILKNFLESYPIKVWLINTGWYGGTYGNEGIRYPLHFTRSCIRAIQNGLAENCKFERSNFFELEIPLQLEGVESHLLDPQKLWKNSNDYVIAAKELKSKFEENYIKLNKD